MRNFIIVILLLSTILACSQPIDENRLYGTYEFNKGKQGMILSLDADHTYKYGSSTDSTGNAGIVGTWEFSGVGNQLVLHKFQFVDHLGKSEFPRGNWVSQVKDIDGEIRFMYSEESNLYFAKIP